MNLLVDPLIFAVPRLETSQEELDDYVEYLSSWGQDFFNGEHNFMVSEACVFALENTGRYPYLDKLQALWEYASETELGCTDVFNACIKVLTNMPYLEDRIPQLKEVALDENSVRVRPDLLQRQPDEVVINAFQETLGHVAYAKFSIPESIATNLLLLSYPIEDCSLAEIWAEVLAQTDEELSVYADVLIITTPDELLDLLDFADFWEDTNRVIRWKARQLQCHEGLSPFKVHTTFNESIKSKGIQNQHSLMDRIFRQCVMLLTMNWTAIEAHELGDPQHECGRWKAFRLYITEDAVGWRLHYWRRGDEFYLMQVTPHNNFDIDEPEEIRDENFTIRSN